MSKKLTTHKFNIYTDGSANIGKGLYGGGAISVKIGGNKPKKRTYRETQIPLYGKHTSLTAEVYAAVHVLNKLPENSKVTLRNDFQEMCHHINKGDLERWAKTQRKKSNEIAINHLFTALARHKEVTAMHTQESKSKYLKKAHILAQSAHTYLEKRAS